MNAQIGGVIVFLLIVLTMAVKIIKQYERGVVFTLGKLSQSKGPGVAFIVPFAQELRRIDMRTVTMDVPAQEIITRDNVPVKVNAVVYYRVLDPDAAVVNVENFHIATSMISQTTLRSVLGENELDDLLTQREKINRKLQEVIDDHTNPWGIKVSVVEVKDVELPSSMQRAMAKQAEAERERRAKIIAAEGEHQASEQLSLAAAVLSREPAALQLRYLQTLVEIAQENNSTTLFPIPIDLMKTFVNPSSLISPAHRKAPADVEKAPADEV